MNLLLSIIHTKITRHQRPAGLVSGASSLYTPVLGGVRATFLESFFTGLRAFLGARDLVFAALLILPS